jgi:copper oxidase (laccase) domain-containing protein
LRELACARAGVPAESVTIRAAIGPCIHACCFEVKEDCLAVVRERVGEDMAAGFIFDRQGKTYLDLPGLNRALLLRAGVAEADIDVCELCTACHPELFYSHRASGGLRGTMLNAIWLAGDEL